jgi:signal transduction histidine kinase
MGSACGVTTGGTPAAYADRVHALYAWPRRHPRILDAALALALVLLSGAAVGRSGRLWAVYALVALAMVAPIVFRRRHPERAFIAAAAVGVVQVTVMPQPAFTDASILVLLYTLAAYRPRRVSVAGLVACFAGVGAAIARWAPQRALHWPYPVLETLSFFAVPITLAWVLGDSMRYRRGYYRALEERADRLERERDAHARIAAAAERARIAREMHDVIAHNVSVMVVQADGAAFALDAEPDRARDALTAISGTGRQALAEMRRLVGVLRTDGEPAELAPQPGLSQISDLLDQARAAGLAVTLAVEGGPRDLPGGADLAAYRVIQESLTNTRKHGGPGASARVTLRYGRDDVRVSVTDDGRGAAAPPDHGGHGGHGLIGMYERVEISGGTVRAGPRTGGGFQVTASLPFVPAAAPMPRPAPAPGPAPRPAPGVSAAITSGRSTR